MSTDSRQMSVSLPYNCFITSPRRVSPYPHAISKHVEQELQNLQDSSHCHRGRALHMHEIYYAEQAQAKDLVSNYVTSHFYVKIRRV
ncbi:Uncharacterised protein [Plesiomonas shigelloides]|nr:Uncharacterised protein [Plesiomonas shigelloides]